MKFKSTLSIITGLLISVNVSACDASQETMAKSEGSKISTSALSANNAAIGTPEADFRTNAKIAAQNFIERFGAQETFAMLGWQANPDYEPRQHCFDYWNEVEGLVLETQKVQDCERQTNDLSRLYASYGVDAKSTIFQSKYYWDQKREFYPVWQNLVKTWETQGGSEDDKSFLKHPVCAKPLQEGWTGSDYFYDGREHPLCRFYKIEALGSRTE